MMRFICRNRASWDRVDILPNRMAVAGCVSCDTEVKSDQFCVVCGAFNCEKCDDPAERGPLPYKCAGCRTAGL